MAANSPVGNVSTIYIKSYDTYDEKTETNISKGFKVNPDTTFQQVDTAMRAIVGLSTDTYDDTILVTNVSVNEVMAE